MRKSMLYLQAIVNGRENSHTRRCGPSVLPLQPGSDPQGRAASRPAVLQYKGTGSLHASTYRLSRGPLFTAHRLWPDTEGYFGPCKAPTSPSGGRQHPHCKNSWSPLFLSVEMCFGAALVIICHVSGQKGQSSVLGEAAAAHRTPQDAAGLTPGTPKRD